jgi:PAS domain S-box-containing protein
MTRAETGETRLPALRGILSTGIYALELVTIVTVYICFVEFSVVLPWINPTATPLWPPTGLALALVQLRGYRICPALIIGSFLATTLGGASPLEAALIALGTAFAALAGAWLISRWLRGRETFRTPLDIAKFSLIAFVPTAMMSSAFATAGVAFANDAGFENFFATWPTWWLADAIETLLVAPVLLLWATKSIGSFSRRSLLETAAVVLVTAAIGAAAYGPEIGSGLSSDSNPASLWSNRSLLGLLVLLPLMRSSLRGKQSDAAAAALVFCGFAAWGFSSGNGPLPHADLNGSLLALAALSIAVSVPSLVLGAAIAAHQETEAHLFAVRAQLSRQLEYTKLASERAKRHFQTLLEGVVDHAVFVLDTSGRVASWNRAAQQIIGYSTEEIIGKHFGIFYRPDERRSGEPNRALESAVRDGKYEIEGWRIRKNGTLFFVTGTITAIRDDEGKLIGLGNVIRDATERRDAQEKLVEAREQLAMAQKMEAIGKLTGGIAHDFNNLLMIIGGNAQTFKRLLDPKLPRAIEAIQTAAKRGESLTRQLLTFSRRQHLSPTVVDLNVCVRNMRTMIESSLRGNIVYNEQIGSEAWLVKVDLAELELAIVNIAVNARDAMPNGGEFTVTTGYVTTSSDNGADRSRGDPVTIQFSDTGVGIPPNLLSKIFDPFFTTKEVGKGTGLGLSQVYGFVHQAGGTIKAESNVGRGTTMTVYLPSCADEEIASDEVSDLDAPRAQRPTVLIVDDSAEVAEVTSSLFEHLGYDTDYRDSADAALKLLAQGRKIDLIFSDIVMPGAIDGVGLAREIRSKYPDVPVLLTTGYSAAAQAAPPDLRILRKPFDAAALRGFIQDIMGESLAS